jgi:hypothetical protein
VEIQEGDSIFNSSLSRAPRRTDFVHDERVESEKYFDNWTALRTCDDISEFVSLSGKIACSSGYRQRRLDCQPTRLVVISVQSSHGDIDLRNLAHSPLLIRPSFPARLSSSTPYRLAAHG